MMTKTSAHDEAVTSYDLRLKRASISQEKLHSARAALGLLFEQTFVESDLAASKFVSFVEKHGLVRAVAKMESSPTKPTPLWKQLKGRVHPFDGMNRERERAVENLASLPKLYREAEQAQQEHQLAQKLLSDAEDRLLAQPTEPATVTRQFQNNLRYRRKANRQTH